MGAGLVGRDAADRRACGPLQPAARRAEAAGFDSLNLATASGIALHVFAHNAAAKALYAQLGFQSTHFNLYKPVGDAAG